MSAIINQVDDDTLKNLVENASDYAGANGIVMIAPDIQNEKRFKHVPFTLFPSPIIKDEFEELISLQPHINQLMHQLSLDHEFLIKTLSSVVQADDFMKNLFDIYLQTYHLNKEILTLGLFRTDYMLDNITKLYKQIEVNTIASSFGGVGTDKIRRLYLTVLKDKPMNSLASRIPTNLTLRNFGKGLAEAWKAYGVADAIIIFFISDKEYNVFDQRAVEYEVYAENPSIVIQRVKFADVTDKLHLDETSRKLYLNNQEVAVTYFRSCYMPQHFPENKHWEARLKIEKSKAVKSPSIGHQLVGSKAIQEVLTRSGIVERYVDVEIAKRIRKTFAGLYSLNMNDAGNVAVQMALQHPEDYVLKPQREGGGNNFYGEDLKRHLQEIGGDDRRCAYVIMEKIRSNPTPNYIISDSKARRVDVISELGVFGVLLTKGGELLSNFTAGHLLRSKPHKLEDGGVVNGVAVLDSPYFVDTSSN